MGLFRWDCSDGIVQMGLFRWDCSAAEAVAPVVLGTIKCLVGGLDYCFGELYFRAAGGVADADGHRQRLLARIVPALLGTAQSVRFPVLFRLGPALILTHHHAVVFDLCTQYFKLLLSLLRGFAGKHDGEFFATVAERFAPG